jgi:hypothetical protein
MEDKSDEAIDKGDKQATGALVRAKRPDATDRGDTREGDNGSGLSAPIEF